ncbi:MAG: efflux RND transporter periplasmic adaptor subunit [Bryobacterales bacterium]|nr:efflux RND transporter periplasmic adaptor subunit [Bryobacteraceae bacterium]MDW8130105.1 efflux RND transporter periplasmic adaptor subunit [Bryobacterales bacterium]
MKGWCVGVLMVCLAAGCSRRADPSKATTNSVGAADPFEVRVVRAETRRAPRELAVTGSLLPDETVQVSAEVAGRVAAIHVDFGQRVRKGDVLVELEKRELELQLARARAALAQALARVGLDLSREEAIPESTPAIRQAQAALEDARARYESAKRLVKTGDIAEQRFIEIEKAYQAREAALEAARHELRVALAAIEALRAEVRLAEKRLADATVRAPFDGAVAARLVAPGQYVRENTPMLTLVKTHPLRLRVEIPESAAALVRVGSTLRFTTDAAPGAEFEATVRELDPALEARSRSLTAEARLRSSDPRLKPGMFVQVRLRLADDATVVVVPRRALYEVAGLTKVFTVEGGRAREHRVTPGLELGDWVEASGAEIRPGDEVIVSGQALLVNGAPVRVQSAEGR